MSLRRLILAIIVLGLGFGTAYAQTGGLTVRVLDASDKSPLPGVVITLTNANGFVAKTAQITGADGTTAFPVLRVGGGYTIEAFLDGYARIAIPDIKVRINENTTIPIQMTPQQVEKIDVIESRPTVDLDKAAPTTKYSDQFIQDLPISGRLYTNILTLAPGVQDVDGDGNPNVHGARDVDFQTTVGGVSNQDPLTGLSMSQVNQDSIEEVEVVPVGGGAEFSGAQGGFAQIIQKQGSNDFEGTFNMLYRSSKLDGNGAASPPPDRETKFNYYQPAISVSGPIVRDKLWYRASHEYLKNEQPISLTSSVAVVTDTRKNFDDAVTWQVSPRNKLSVQYRYDPITVENFGVSDAVPVSASRRFEIGGPTYSLTWTAPYSPKLFVETVAAYQDHKRSILPTQTGVENRCLSSSAPSVALAQCFDGVTGQLSGSFPIDRRDRSQRLTVDARGTYYAGRFWGATHQLKFGLAVANERFFREETVRPQMSFAIITPLDENQQPGQGPTIERIARVALSFAFPETTSSRSTGNKWGVFVEDQLKPLSNLTLNLGARFDRLEINSDGFEPFDPDAEAKQFIDNLLPDRSNLTTDFEESFTRYEGIEDLFNAISDYLGGVNLGYTGPTARALQFQKVRRPGSVNIVNNDFSPRLSVSWDPWSTGKTKFTALVGRYYATLNLDVPLVELGPTIANLDLTAEQGADGGYFLPATTIPLSPGLNVSVVDRNLRTPYKDTLAFTFEREIAPETLLRFTYVKNRFKDQLQDIDINKTTGDYGRCVLQASASAPYYMASPGAGATLVDAFSGESYTDTDPGDGDGRIDDCLGNQILLPNSGSGSGGLGPQARLVQRPDGIPDLYVQNPGWGAVYLVGNFNTTDYTSYGLQLERRLYRNWQLDASYTWSKAIGDAEDFQSLVGDDRSLLEDERGYLSYDQRHVLKVNATTQTPWGVRLGTVVTWQSGVPYSILRRQRSFQTVRPELSAIGNTDSPVRLFYPTGQRNDQRNVSYWNFDVKATKEFTLRGGVNLQLSADIFNLLNNGTYFVYNPITGYGQQVNGLNEGVHLFGRQFQIGARVAF